MSAVSKMEEHDTIIVGGGQAGLAMSYQLKQRGREHIVLERGRIAERWLSERWDTLHFQFPNWMVQLPGKSLTGCDPDAFSHRDEIARFIRDYAISIGAPVRTGVEVTSLTQEGSRFVVQTRNESLIANRVVIATGPFQRPSIPDFSKRLGSGTTQIHANDYKNPQQLPDGAVLIVGSGASGYQIAEDLLHDGRKIYLCVGPHRRVPRRYRGHDMAWWFQKMGRFDVTLDSFPSRVFPPSVVVTAVDGGHDANVRDLAAKGVVVLGNLNAIDNGRLALSDNAESVLSDADRAYWDFRRQVDEFAAKSGLDVPIERGERVSSDPIPSRPSLDLAGEGISSVVWCTGYAYDLSWIRLPVFDKSGAPIQSRGVSTCPGLTFLGLHWMHTFKSGLLFGVGDDAAYLADQISPIPASSRKQTLEG